MALLAIAVSLRGSSGRVQVLLRCYQLEGREWKGLLDFGPIEGRKEIDGRGTEIARLGSIGVGIFEREEERHDANDLFARRLGEGLRCLRLLPLS
jgi:hypothetical protein